MQKPTALRVRVYEGSVAAIGRPPVTVPGLSPAFEPWLSRPVKGRACSPLRAAPPVQCPAPSFQIGAGRRPRGSHGSRSRDPRPQKSRISPYSRKNMGGSRARTMKTEIQGGGGGHGRTLGPFEVGFLLKTENSSPRKPRVTNHIRSQLLLIVANCH